MATTAAGAAWRMVRWLSPTVLTGPIFDKELRVSSRRKRNYVLRTVYLALLGAFVLLVWVTIAEDFGRSSSAYTISRMSVAGRIVISSLAWFQFCALQLVAVVMLSTSISDEIYHKTLGVLMTTPINSFQIVVGKLLSKLWQLFILLAISVPVLAVVRVFGGVPWRFVISSTCITLTAVIFAGAVSIHYSVRSRRAYAVIIQVLISGFVIYAMAPGIVAALVGLWGFAPGHEDEWLSVLLAVNPFAAMSHETFTMAGPMFGTAGPWFHWPVHCAVMLGASALVMARTVRIVRKAALRQAVGESGLKDRKARRTRKTATATAGAEPPSEGAIHRVKGSPIVWKELRAPLVTGGRRTHMFGAAFAVLAMIVTYCICGAQNCLDDSETHVGYCIIFVLLGMLVCGALSATTITSEKETRAWPILLATPLGDWHILLGKAVGVLRKCAPIWALLAVHVLIFTYVKYIHPIAILHLAIIVAGVTVFFAGTGLYFSARFKRTTTAVVMNVGLALALWVLVPMLAGFASVGMRTGDPIEWVFMANPVVQAGVVVEGSAGMRHAARRVSVPADYRARRDGNDRRSRLPSSVLSYNWPVADYSAMETTGIVLVSSSLYVVVGLLFACSAPMWFRRNVF
jgi:ABC-type transport system involved in multi-copper enzyme maturation permease subunit